ncbi:hypothetical protein EJB05_05905, partial [Eragrostis curvula]
MQIAFIANIFRRLSLRKARSQVEVSSSTCSVAMERSGEHDDNDVSAALHEKPVLGNSFWALRDRGCCTSRKLGRDVNTHSRNSNRYNSVDVTASNGYERC